MWKPTAAARFIVSCAVVLCLAQATAAEPAPLAQLAKAIERLRTSKAPETFFLLDSPQLPASTVFRPDTKGGAYLVIARRLKTSNGKLREFYSEGDWRHLVKSVKRWHATEADAANLGPSGHTLLADADVVLLRIPKEVEPFFTDLLAGWKIDRKDFTIDEIDWN